MPKRSWILLVSAVGILVLLASLMLKDSFGPSPSLDPKNPAAIEWGILAKWQAGAELPSTLSKLDNSIVRIPGFMIPLDYSTQAIREFLFVPNLPACMHVPPPPPNQTIYVKMQKDVESTYEAFWITGRLKITPTGKGSPRPEALYEMEGWEYEPYKNL